MHFLDFESKERHLLVLTLMSKSMVQCVLRSSSVLKDEVQTLSVLSETGSAVARTTQIYKLS